MAVRWFKRCAAWGGGLARVDEGQWPHWRHFSTTLEYIRDVHAAETIDNLVGTGMWIETNTYKDLELDEGI